MAAEKSVEFSSNQKPAEAAISLGIGEMKNGSCLQNAGFERVKGYCLLKAPLATLSIEVLIPLGKILSKCPRGLARPPCSDTRWIWSRSEVVSEVVLRLNQTRTSAVNSFTHGSTFGSRTDMGVWNGQSLQIVVATTMQA